MKLVLFLSFLVVISLAGVQSRYTQPSRKEVVYQIHNDVLEILEKIQVDFENLLRAIQKEGSLSIPMGEWNFFTDLKDKIVSKFHSATKAMSHLKNKLKEIFVEDYADIGHWLKSAKDFIVDDLEDTNKAIQQLEREISEAISLGSRETAECLKALKKEIQNDLTSARVHIIQMADLVGGGINESNAAIKKQFIDLKEKVVAGLRKTKEEMVIVGGKIKGEMSAITRWFKTHFTKEKFEELFHKIKEVLQDVYDMIPKEVKEAAAQTFEEIVNEVKETIANEGKVHAQNAIEKLETALSDQIDKAVDRLQDLISGH